GWSTMQVGAGDGHAGILSSQGCPGRARGCILHSQLRGNQGAPMTLLVETRDVAAERAAIDAEVAGKTLLGAFAETVERLRDAEALKWKVDGAWQALTWRQYREAVAEVAVGLTKLGFQPGQFAVLLSRNLPQPMIADLGVQHARGVPVFLYNTLAPEQAAYIVNHCEARVAFVENRDFLSKMLLPVRDELTTLRKVVLFEGEGDWATTFDELRAAGREALQRDPSAFDALWKLVAPEDLAALIYTSGTTGRPKGVMTSQRNVMWEACAVGQLAPPRPDERSI